MMPAGYCTGRAEPAKGTSLPPSSRCRSKRTVGFAADALASSTRGSFDKSHGSQATSNEVSWPLLSWIPERFTDRPTGDRTRSEEHTSELQSLIRISYAVVCFKKTKLYE